MPDPIKVLPNTDDAVGLVHPVDGPLAAEGSTWSYDSFTIRRLDESVIRRFEMQPEAKPADAASDAPAGKTSGK